MSSPFQRAFSSKSPIKQNHTDSKVELAPDRPMKDIQKTYDDNIAYAKGLLNRGKLSKENYQSVVDEENAMLKDWKIRKTAKPSLMDVAAGPTPPLFPAQRVWEKAKKVYQAIDTPEERTAIKDKLVEGWKNIKGPRSTKVDN
jgi:hypothetical protein|tara:strand:- start:305 stop:733 length:429 start_codon:yes stop_codon:yes gene_type:complete